MRTKVIGIASGKGGVGKSFVSLNLAIELAVQKKKVLLIDADVGLGNIHIMLGKNPDYNIVDIMEGKCKLEDSLIELVRGNLKILSGGSGLKKIFHTSREKNKRLFNELKKVDGKFDVVMLDIGAGINKEVLSFLELSDEIVLVTNPDVTAMADAYALLKTISMSKTISRNFGVVINKSDQDMADEVFKKLHTAANKFLKCNLKLLGNIEENRKLAFKSVQKRLPLYYLNPGAKIRKQFYKLSLKVFYDKELHYGKSFGIVNKLMKFLKVEG